MPYKDKEQRKEYQRKYMNMYSKTKKGLITSIYSRQKYHSKCRNDAMPAYSLNELRIWCLMQSKFHELYNVWIKSGHEKDLIPSVDRKDDYKGYSLDNIQLMTWIENKNKYHLDALNGTNNKQGRPVIGVNIKSNEVLSFLSIGIASRELDKSRTGIGNALRGLSETSGGFKWYYENDYITINN